MDIENRLRKLESCYRSALSATVAAKANYLALAGEPCATPAAIERAQSLWRQVDAWKRTIALQMGERETLEDATDWRPPLAHNSSPQRKHQSDSAIPCTFQYRLTFGHSVTLRHEQTQRARSESPHPRGIGAIAL